MASKNRMNLIYIIGCALVVLGFCTPIFKFPIIGGINGFNVVKTYNNNGATLEMICSVLILAAAVCGIILDYFTGNFLGDLVTIAVSALSGIIIFMNTSELGAKLAGKCTNIGFYLLIAGWIVAIVGLALKKIKK